MTPYVLPRALLISEFNELSYTILKKLRENNFSVSIVCANPSLWKRRDENENTLFFNQDNIAKEDFSELFNYIICIPKFSFSYDSNKEDDTRDLKKINLAKNFSRSGSSKTLFVFSYILRGKTHGKVSEIVDEILSDNKIFAGSIFLGELVFETKDRLGYFNEILERLIAYGKLGVPKNFVFYPISVPEASQLLLRSLFSLKAYNKKTAIIGKGLPVSELQRYLRKIYPGFNIVLEKGLIEYFRPEVQEKIYSSENKKNLVFKAISLTDKHKPKERSLSAKKKKRVFKALFTFFLFTFFIIPLLLITLSISGLAFSKKLFNEGFLDASEKQLRVSLFFSETGEKYFNLLTRVSLLGKPYQNLSDTSGVLNGYANVGLNSIKTFELASELVESVMNEEDYDLNEKVNEIVLEMDNLYKEIGFLEGEIQNSNLLTQKVSAFIFDREDLDKVKDKVHTLSTTFTKIQPLLGEENPVKYLVLFQNNSVARPTGGVIDSFIIITFSDGKLVDIKVYDTSDSDKNLSGIVEPPLPLKKYFGINTWYLRDSNWDPDFQISASQAEWFIDKEIDENINGVVSFDANFLRDLIQERGKFVIEGEKEKVNSENLFEVIKEIKDKEKAPATFILEKLFSEREKFSKRKKVKVLQLIFEGLEKKNILTFIKDPDIQENLQELGWTGQFDQKECSDNCYYDQLAVVESAFSGNSLNINREMELSIFLEENLLKRKLLIYFENKSNEPYKTYLRLFVPGGAGFSPPEIIGLQGKESTDLDIRGIRGFKEAGLFLEVPGRETKAISFLWESGSSYSYERPGEYKLYWWKQPGLKDFPLELLIKTPSKLNFKATHPFVLTDGNLLRYNTLLSQGTTLRLFWDKNE
ncbi:MAG: hypothetical protein UT24_C0017G0016 [Candidatus Woesebacteria bacterium GW2011_GWB1_39_12]|uniref:Tetratricopeptide TPR_2 repeat protein n=2 Tax=Candidatus Woeseibacteriota TaxID=1752722 RepID=A0A0G0M3S6_9BACT|nr:MAG: hypothetical protein UT23_C0006G0008 [Candidatus Woesebacteria bacterium GW2011_GWA1_39_12]KKR00090.1 MAG: hypothetical protein UT24_C0017G0016 [Candidatus Woesebacteria bacterium GW2011_GWB1_39_12]